MDIIIPQTFPANRLRSTINGLPARGMELLYMLDDAGQVDGTTWSGSTALDTSGNERHGTFYTGSSKIKRAATPDGVGTSSGANNGLAIVSPLAISGPFTILMTVRQTQPLGVNGPGSGYVTWYRSSAAMAALTGAQASNPGFSISDDAETGAGETSPRKLRMLVPSQAGGPASAVDETITPSISKSSVMSFACAVDPTAGTVTLRAGNATLELNDVDDPGVSDAIYTGTTPTHVFGVMKLASGQVSGRLGLAAVFSYAATVAEMDQMIAAAKAIKGGS